MILPRCIVPSFIRLCRTICAIDEPGFIKKHCAPVGKKHRAQYRSIFYMIIQFEKSLSKQKYSVDL